MEAQEGQPYQNGASQYVRSAVCPIPVFMYYLSLLQLPEVGATIIPILQMRNLGPRLIVK